MSKMVCLSRIDQHSLLPFFFLISKHCVNILNFDWSVINRSYILWSKKTIWWNLVQWVIWKKQINASRAYLFEQWNIEYDAIKSHQNNNWSLWNCSELLCSLKIVFEALEYGHNSIYIGPILDVYTKIIWYCILCLRVKRKTKYSLIIMGELIKTNKWIRK